MSERSYDAERKAATREKDREIKIPPVADPDRRLRAESDGILFLETYFPDRFFDDWTDDRRLMVEQIRYRARFGGDKAIAAPRGEGKTTFAECEVGVDAIVNGLVSYPLIVAASGPDAERILGNIKAEYETNEILQADYPEVCAPIVALDGAPNRANMQKHGGKRTRLKWSAGHIVFPTITLTWCDQCYNHETEPRGPNFYCRKCDHTFKAWQSKASGSIIEAKGLDGTIRGLRRGRLRPDFVIIDDAETRESARSSIQIEERGRTIENDIGGLGGGRKPVARLMLCTIQNTMCLASKYTDRMQKPSWDGNRLGLVRKWPDNTELWEKYVELWKTGMQEDPPDKLARKAHQFYLDNRAEMDAGCVVSNPSRFNDDILEDGSKREVSTIQHVHNEAAKKGWDYVHNELQNDPKEEDTEGQLQLSVGIITGTHSAYHGRLNGLPPGTAPADTTKITAFVDVQHDRLYFVVVAWQKGNRRSIIDWGEYGAEIGGNLPLIEATIQRIVSLKSMFADNPYEIVDGGSREPDVTAVDSGDGQTQTAVYSACLMTGWLPTKGDHRFHKPGQDRTNKGPDPWYAKQITHEGKRLKLYVFSVEPFRAQCRASWLEPPEDTKSGSVFLFGDNPAVHGPFGEHLCVRFERYFNDRKNNWVEEWIEPRRHDFWDCDYGTFVAFSIAIHGKQDWHSQEKVKWFKKAG